MTMWLSPTSRGLRLVRATRSPLITLPPPAPGGPQALLVTDTQDEITTETGARIITETT
jgi:hypothetical protein